MLVEHLNCSPVTKKMRCGCAQRFLATEGGDPCPSAWNFQDQRNCLHRKHERCVHVYIYIYIYLYMQTHLYKLIIDYIYIYIIAFTHAKKTSNNNNIAAMLLNPGWGAAKGGSRVSRGSTQGRTTNIELFNEKSIWSTDFQHIWIYLDVTWCTLW